MDTSANHLYAALLVGTIGFGLFLYGKKERRAPQAIAGLVLMAFPYFVPSPLWMLVVAAVLVVGLWLVLRAGG